MGKLSIVVPCYNEEESLPRFYTEVRQVLLDMQRSYGVEYEILLVNDGSSDQTLEKMRTLSDSDPDVLYLSFSRNFGKEAALYAGLEHCTGDYVAVMDADLQDPPKLLGEMYEAIVGQGYDCVGTRRVTRRGEPHIRSFFARMFYRLINKISKTELVDGARDYRLMTRQMVEEILRLGEYNRFSKGIFSWVGFETKWLEYENVPRIAGTTKWSFWGLFLYSMDGILAFSTAPLAIASLLGLLLFLVVLAVIVFVVVKTILWGDPVAGYPSLICTICLIGGLQLFCLGILGQYLAKLYMEAKKRPIYIVKESKINQCTAGEGRSD